MKNWFPSNVFAFPNRINLCHTTPRLMIGEGAVIDNIAVWAEQLLATTTAPPVTTAAEGGDAGAGRVV